MSFGKEWSLISSSLSPTLEKLSVARLKSKTARALKLRQKYHDLYRREAILSKSRVTGSHTKPNVGTRRKEKMFDEAITRLKMQIHKASVSHGRHTETKMRATSKALRGADRKTTVHQRRHRQVAASTRRRQAKRDSRGRLTA